MRNATIRGLIILGAACLVMIPAVTWGQPGGGGRFPFGGSKGGGPVSMLNDPNKLFEYYARDRNFFLVTDTKSLRDPLTQYAESKGIKDGKISRAQFIEFSEQLKAKLASGATTLAPPGGGKKSFGFPGMGPKGPDGVAPAPGAGPTGSAPNPDVINQLADVDFRRRDMNEDGKLNPEEMSGSLRDNLEKWDTNKDGAIDIQEYRAYFTVRLLGNVQDPNSKAAKPNPIATIIIEEEDWDRRPTVLRAGKLHKDLPSWFKELDSDQDGQVSLYEWRKGSRPLDEFRTWDTNNDGLITQEEAIRINQAVLANKSGKLPMTAAGANNSTRTGKGGELKEKKFRP